MSKQHTSSDQSSQRNVYTGNIDIGIGKQEPSTHTGDMATLYQFPKELDLNYGRWGGEQLDEQQPTTKTLHKGQDGKPAITLTTYQQQQNLPTNTNSTSILSFFKPIDPSPFNETPKPAPQERYVTSRADIAALAGANVPVLLQLRYELEDHFQGLKREFETKTGKGWTPLRPWAKEECESEGDDVAGMWGWVEQ